MRRGRSNKEILVTDLDWKFLPPTHDRKALNLIADGKAKLLGKDPLLLQLNRKLDKEELKMPYRSINEYFEQNKDVYIQNVSGGVVSLSLYHEDGRVEPFSLPNDRRPICLTDHMPYNLIIQSTDIRRLVQRQPPAIKLLNRAEYEEMIGIIARETGKSTGQVISEVTEKITNAQAHVSNVAPTPVYDDEVPPKIDPRTIRQADIDIPGTTEPSVNPHVMQIIMSSSPDAPTRMTANEAIEQLALMNLTEDDLAYVAGNASLKPIIKWAEKQKTKQAPAKAAEK
jgi:hypothetical protein